MKAALGQYIRARRQELGLSASEVAERIGISRADMSGLEIGRTRLPHVERRRAIAEALRVRHVDILIAAGELREDELPTVLRAVQPSSECDEIMASLSTEARQSAMDVLRMIRRMDQRLRSVDGMPTPDPNDNTPANAPNER